MSITIELDQELIEWAEQEAVRLGLPNAAAVLECLVREKSSRTRAEPTAVLERMRRAGRDWNGTTFEQIAERFRSEELSK